MISIAVLILSCFYGVSGQWSYNDETQWPGKCTSGQQQSPINIMTRDTVLDVSGTHIQGPLVLRGYSNLKVSAFNNGHTRIYPLEIHMVHIKTGLTVEEAVQRPDGLAVLGIMAQVVNEVGSSYALDQIMPFIPEILDKSRPHTEPAHIDLTRLFSPVPQSYFTYAGSLTTPNCDEAVTWIVNDKPIAMSDEQYKVFSEVNVGTISNYRRLQPANRVVYRSMASCALTLTPSLLTALTGIFHCISGKISTSIAKGICYVINVKRKFFGLGVKECSKALL